MTSLLSLYNLGTEILSWEVIMITYCSCGNKIHDSGGWDSGIKIKGCPCCRGYSDPSDSQEDVLKISNINKPGVYPQSMIYSNMIRILKYAVGNDSFFSGGFEK